MSGQPDPPDHHLLRLPGGYPVVWAAFGGGHVAAPQDGATGDSGSATHTGNTAEPAAFTLNGTTCTTA